MGKIWLIKAVIFLSSFLLFQIELIVGKIFLPNFGGSYLVWGACVVFFQAALLAGYQYAHLVLEKLSIRRYRVFHLLLLSLPLLTFPGHELPMRFPVHQGPLVLNVFGQLVFSVGLVFFALSTTSIIWQVWLSSSRLPERSNPYVLFAVSNLGSFVALLSYPFVFELFFDLHVQQQIWRLLYLLVLLLQAVALVLIDVDREEEADAAPAGERPRRNVLPWFLYSAAGVMMFLSVTNIVTAEVAPIPLLWVIPLAIYLLSFVCAFKKKPFAPKWLLSREAVILGQGMLFYLIVQARILPMVLTLAALFFITFAVCLLAQHKLYSLKPARPRDLPYYYLVIAWGGFFGGVMVTWVMPLITTGMLEYFLAFLAIGLAAGRADKKPGVLRGLFLSFVLLSVLAAWRLRYPDYCFWPLVLCLVFYQYIFSRLIGIRGGILLASCVIVLMVQYVEPIWGRDVGLYVRRNYYGINEIWQNTWSRYFLHGTTIHGAQSLDPATRPLPLTYYGLDSTMGKVLTTPAFHFRNIAVLGLGIGTVATYFDASQRIDFFELDPDVVRLAQKYFTYLGRSRGRLRYYTGDARLSLNGIEKHKYDLIIADAFSGDSIPVHLLTQEAIGGYRDHLKDDGLILFNITNRYIDPGPPLAATAVATGAFCCASGSHPTYRGTFPSVWVAVTWDRDVFRKLVKELKWIPARSGKMKQYRVWTDRYSSFLPYIRYGDLWHQMIHFKYL